MLVFFGSHRFQQMNTDVKHLIIKENKSAKVNVISRKRLFVMGSWLKFHHSQIQIKKPFDDLRKYQRN